MGLPLPNLDDKTFFQLALEGRSLIPGAAPEWTDHNVHDPGITFAELFAWLAEIEHYRLNRPSEAIFSRFFSLIGLKRLGRRAAEVTLESEFDALKKAIFVPANTPITPIGAENAPFQTLRDAYLTTAELKTVITHAGGRRIRQMKAEANLAGHYEAFGPDPRVGDYLELGFQGWFDEEQGQLDITLFEVDLPSRTEFAPNAAGFVSSAKVRWEYRTGSSVWSELPIIEDGTLNFSRSGELIFRKPEQQPFTTDAPGNIKLNSIRAILVEGHFEIPPRIFSVVTNTLRARQVELIVNEDHGRGTGAPDQELRLRKAPLLLDPRTPDGPFQAGEVLDWRDLVLRLAHRDQQPDSPQKKAVAYVAKKLVEAGGVITPDSPIDDDEKYRLAQAFNKLLEDVDFYRRDELDVVHQTEEFLELKADLKRACQAKAATRRFNRFLLQRVFPDLFLSDRIEIQTDRSATCGAGGMNTWSTWERVDNFLQSGPKDLHYILDAQAGVIYFGNGLNGSAPQPEESIRARFYRISQGAKGNLATGKRWRLAVAIETPPDAPSKLWSNPAPATGGKEPESLDDAKARSREIFRKQSPVLTAKDYEAATLRTPGLRVARAKVVANFNPRLPKLALPGDLTVIVLPQPAPRNVFPNAAPPAPSDGFLKTVASHLDTLRMVTTDVHVTGPEYRPVDVTCRVFLQKRAPEEKTMEEIRKVLNAYLDPINGGPEGNAGWPFGRSVFPSEIHQKLSKVEFVDYVTEVGLNGQKAGQELRLPYNGLPKPGKLQVELIPFERRRQATKAGKGDSDCE